MDDATIHFGYKQKIPKQNIQSKTLILLLFVYTIRYTRRTNTQLVTQGADGAANHVYVQGRRRAISCVRTQEERERERERERDRGLTHLDSVVTSETYV